MKYVNKMLIVYLYADKLEPCVIPRVELCSLNIIIVNGADITLYVNVLFRFELWEQKCFIFALNQI
jgi:hypothetical protein